VDYLSLSDFDPSALKRHVLQLNPDITVFEVSCKTGQGLDAWCTWLSRMQERHETSYDPSR
jgi:hydrogenase nickel incorporation protein HypB